MSLARSTYYYRPRGRGRDDEELIGRIGAICEEFPRYGYQRVKAQLRHDGWQVNHKKVARIMRERGLSVKPRRQAVRTSDGGCREAVFPNRARHFIPGGPNELWVGDIMYIRIRLAFVYLAVILDAWSRRVVGYAVSRQIDTRLTLAALRAALADRWPPPLFSRSNGQTGTPKRLSALIAWNLFGLTYLALSFPPGSSERYKAAVRRGRNHIALPEHMAVDHSNKVLVMVYE